MLNHTDFASLSEEDITKLIDLETPEDRYLEYKRELPGNSYDEVKEFLADVSAFANASGGVIIYGLAEEEGIAKEIVGIATENIDKEILRLKDRIRQCIKPIIIEPQIDILSVEQKQVLLIRIPKSWIAPHVVSYKKHWRFYIRTSAGKDPMDIQEVRSIMINSYNLPEKIRAFRDEQLNLIENDLFPVPLAYSSPIVLHLIPFTAITNPGGSQIDLDLVRKNWHMIPPPHSRSSHHRYNLEGYLIYGNIVDDGKFNGYVQIYRNGIIEAVNTSLLRSYDDAEKSVPSQAFEEEVANSVYAYLEIQKQLGIVPPIAFYVSILNIRDYYLAVNPSYDRFGDKKYLLKRDSLLLPEVIIEDYPDNVPATLKGLFDTLWNAFGWPRSLNYDENGAWKLSIQRTL